jgi:cellulose synthase/poly-beta-1,6-N-acetylglucosamine synthase-like glycosyltransferase
MMMIGGPVLFHKEKTVFERFQSLDFIGMMGITAGGLARRIHAMCNGANLCYEKSAFEEVGGFRDIDGIASGDDMLLMHKILKKYPNGIGYVKNANAATITAPERTFGNFFNQRKRWASKTRHYQEKTLVLIPGFVFLICLLILSGFILSFFKPEYFLLPTIALFLSKTIADYFFLSPLVVYYRRADLMKYFLLSQPFHVLYILATGFSGLFLQTYVWKGRNVN